MKTRESRAAHYALESSIRSPEKKKLERLRMKLCEIDANRRREEALRENQDSNNQMSNPEFAFWILVVSVFIFIILKSEQWDSIRNFIVQALNLYSQ